MLGIVLLTLLLVFAPSSALSLDFTVPAVEQCEPVTISFNGNINGDAGTPISILVVPIDSIPFTLSIPLAEDNASNVTLPFLSLAAGSTFLLALDNAAGTNNARSSSLMAVLPSPSRNSRCLDSNSKEKRRPLFRLSSLPLAACASFDVSFDTNHVRQAPRIHALYPEGESLTFTAQDYSIAEGVASYTYASTSTSPVVLIFDDGEGHTESTELLSVKEASATDSSCLASRAPQEMSTPSGLASGKPKLSSIAITAIAVSSAVVACSIIAIIAILAIRRSHRRYLGKRSLSRLESCEIGSRTPNVGKALPKIPGESPEELRFQQNHTYPPDYKDSSPELKAKSSWANSTLQGMDVLDHASPIKKTRLSSLHSFRRSLSVCSQDMDYIRDIASAYLQRKSSMRTTAGSSIQLQPSPDFEPMSPESTTLQHTPTIQVNRPHSGSPSSVPQDALDPANSLILPSPNVHSFPAALDDRPASLPVSIKDLDELGAGPPSSSPPNLPPFQVVARARSLRRTPSSRSTRREHVTTPDRTPRTPDAAINITNPSRVALGGSPT